jgi:hypothetical protein
MATYEPAGVEEMPDEIARDPARSEPSSPVAPAAATRDQLREIGNLIATLDDFDPDTDWKARAQEMAGVPARMLTQASARVLIGRLVKEIERLQPAA